VRLRLVLMHSIHRPSRFKSAISAVVLATGLLKKQLRITARARPPNAWETTPQARLLDYAWSKHNQAYSTILSLVEQQTENRIGLATVAQTLFRLSDGDNNIVDLLNACIPEGCHVNVNNTPLGFGFLEITQPSSPATVRATFGLTTSDPTSFGYRKADVQIKLLLAEVLINSNFEGAVTTLQDADAQRTLDVIQELNAELG